MTKNYAKERYIPKHLNTKIKENDHFDFYYNFKESIIVYNILSIIRFSYIIIYKN